MWHSFFSQTFHLVTHYPQRVPRRFCALNWTALLAFGGRGTLGDTLGIPTTGSYRSERHNVDEDILTLGEGPHAVELDLMEPVDPSRSPRVNSPALNHIGLWVDDLHAVEPTRLPGNLMSARRRTAGAAGARACLAGAFSSAVGLAAALVVADLPRRFVVASRSGPI